MKTDLIHALTDTFEAYSQQTDGGVEFWLARDLQYLLGYAEWRNFTAVISKAKTACEVSGHSASDHFVDINKMVDLGSGSQREVPDLMLTRYACYFRHHVTKHACPLEDGCGVPVYECMHSVTDDEEHGSIVQTVTLEVR